MIRAIRYSVRVKSQALASAINFALTSDGILRVKATLSPVGVFGGLPTFRFRVMSEGQDKQNHKDGGHCKERKKG